MTDTLAANFPYPYFVAAVGVECWSYLPAIYCMRSPAGALRGLFMDEYPNAGWCNWCAIEIVETVYLCII